MVLQYGLPVLGEENCMRLGKGPPCGLTQWLEFLWLWLADPTFREARNKRKAYYEHCLAKSITSKW